MCENVYLAFSTDIKKKDHNMEYQDMILPFIVVEIQLISRKLEQC